MSMMLLLALVWALFATIFVVTPPKKARKWSLARKVVFIIILPLTVPVVAIAIILEKLTKK